MMRTDQAPRSGKPGGNFLRRFILVLVLTLVVFGIIGAVVTLLPRNMERQGLGPGKVPQAHQIDRKSLRQEGPRLGS
ncbi:MAG: hypothetical protein JZU50_15590 [Desulfobulbaceae bacterium]|nr:hypothetical protein [Desulfobulbaceae bacterium]